MRKQILNILCADDEPMLCNLLEDYLTQSNHKVDIAHDGSTAYHYVRMNSYDLVFMDLGMPIMNGLDSVRAIRERNMNVYIVLMSGSYEHNEVLQAFRSGANAFLPKPFNAAMLQQLVDSILQKNQETCCWYQNNDSLTMAHS